MNDVAPEDLQIDVAGWLDVCRESIWGSISIEPRIVAGLCRRLLAAEPEAKRLRAAIVTHRAQRGDDRCWLDDRELYEALEDGDGGNLSLPPKCEFLASCERFWEQRQDPRKKGGVSGMTIAQLEAALAEAKAEVAGLRSLADSLARRVAAQSELLARRAERQEDGHA